MPLLKRKDVPKLPPPAGLAELPDDQEVWYMAKTGEVFLDYEAYSNRLAYYMRRIFACSSSGRTGMDYFSALASEQRESEVVKSRFPVELKPRVLKSVNFQMEGRLDSLIDMIYDRFHNRFFRREKVFVDLQGDKYYAQISKIFPPKPVRELARSSLGLPSTSGSPLKNEVYPTFPSGSSVLSPPPPSGPIGSPVLGVNVSPNGGPDPQQRLEQAYNELAHTVGTDLDLEAKDAAARDDPEEYLYTVQLMDENSNFEGSYMEVKSKQLGRDRLSFSKSILKRYIRESVHRDPAIGSPWEIKPTVAKQFGLSTTMSANRAERNALIKQGKLSRRRKAVVGGSDAGSEVGDVSVGGEGKVVKRRKGPGKGAKGGEKEEETSEVKKELARRERELQSGVKYPLEDLDLSPLSIIDGRMLRRVSGAMPDLPKKPLLRRDLPAPSHLFDRFLQLWNFLNTFGRALQLSPFTIDDFADALNHPTHDPPSVLLGDIHGTLVGMLGAHNDLRYPGTVSCTADGVLPYFARSPSELALLSVKHQEHWIRQALLESKKWDRGPKRKGDEVRERWEVRVTGALCQRGAVEVMPSLGRLMRFLYAAKGLEEPGEDERKGGVGCGQRQGKARKHERRRSVKFADEDATMEDATEEKMEGVQGEEEDQLADNDSIEEEAEADPRERYPLLPLESKLDILQFLCDVVRDSRVVRNHIDEAEGMLTELRKERADANKEKKQLMEEIAARDAKKKEGEGEGADATSEGPAAPTTTAKANGTVTANGTNTAATSNQDDDDNVDMLDWSDDAQSAAPATTRTSRKPTSEPEAEIDELASDSSYAASGSGSPVVETAPLSGARSSHVSARRAALESRLAKREAEEKAKAKSAKEGKQAEKTKRKAYDERKRLDEDLQKCVRKEDSFSREFRRWAGVTRVRPLGQDRFHCRYWWLDGVGAMNLVGQGGNYLWSTGRIFVSAPSKEEWEAICDEHGGEEEMEERIRKEEGNGEDFLKPDEWGWIGDEAELDQLVPWLNQKGRRELELRMAIKDWREYIVGGMKRRIKQQEELEARLQDDEDATRRSNRGKTVPAFQHKPYMSYKNKLAA